MVKKNKVSTFVAMLVTFISRFRRQPAVLLKYVFSPQFALSIFLDRKSLILVVVTLNSFSCRKQAVHHLLSNFDAFYAFE
jgi:hypothetical protein